MHAVQMRREVEHVAEPLDAFTILETSRCLPDGAGAALHERRLCALRLRFLATREAAAPQPPA